ncbi:hypothetical protein [Pararhodobacter sp.]|uniref:hypothetical protein n=1 Tax=Pararhodobacter sp. TaxID=2127056 RepID=UPI002AFFF7B3|nr:hypothetical protein [Pararhodobacter sp.]
MPRVTHLSSPACVRRIPSPGDLRNLRRSIAQEGRRRRSRWTTPRMMLAALVMLILAPVAGAIAGVTGGSAAVISTSGCQLLSVVDGNTVELSCVDHEVRHHHVMGLSSPPVLGARCLAEAWWGLRAHISLRAQVWQAETLAFVEEPRAHLVLMLADGIPVHRLVPTPPRDPCA